MIYFELDENRDLNNKDFGKLIANGLKWKNYRIGDGLCLPKYARETKFLYEEYPRDSLARRLGTILFDKKLGSRIMPLPTKKESRFYQRPFTYRNLGDVLSANKEMLGLIRVAILGTIRNTVKKFEDEMGFSPTNSVAWHFRAGDVIFRKWSQYYWQPHQCDKACKLIRAEKPNIKKIFMFTGLHYGNEEWVDCNVEYFNKIKNVIVSNGFEVVMISCAPEEDIAALASSELLIRSGGNFSNIAAWLRLAIYGESLGEDQFQFEKKIVTIQQHD
jgi:hypothetical protein